MPHNTYCIIMAGGVGTRFWPKSRQSMPKQFLDIFGTGKSFIRSTYERFAPIVLAENFLVVTNRKYRDLVLQHLPELREQQILCEPVGRNTAPCIAYAAYKLLGKDPDAEMIVTPSDHLILNETDFRQIIGECVDFAAANDALMTVGIQPTRPETGYGYIQVSDGQTISKVKCFTEKPDLEMAQTFLQSGEFFWNSGIFIWTVRSIVAAFKKYLPDHDALFAPLMQARDAVAEQKAVETAFSECRAISIDYGILEKADNVYVRCGDFGWSDMGTWGSVYMQGRKDRYANVAPAEGCHLYETRSSIISLPKGKIAAISGLKDFIVVDTDDVLMICPRADEQNIKKFIDEVKFHDGDKFI